MIFKREACVETYQEALQAQYKGANQIELCSRLDLDGLTPDEELIKKCHANLSLDIKVMIRPRSGNFEYSDIEIAQLIQEIEFANHLGSLELFSDA